MEGKSHGYFNIINKEVLINNICFKLNYLYLKFQARALSVNDIKMVIALINYLVISLSLQFAFFVNSYSNRNIR